ncbi:3-phosphoshikimate 1-carboxyvinyltransferase [Criibacterium bergeronii]|uniref:3-phosphoshikimate 1-carboxyvinyltransferase n=1 Tax=Criibacterium bergeronii TaxID=1871336 RepID=A0A552VBE9_9FIRM|nr:3-phosphoshikimate 1-carboxyvinyltransferase [Criibacterium bergeronii]TRW27801.1 3-phosphoshikimate 1-carboxyvinyltransferase [Criibacterium bergeronii]
MIKIMPRQLHGNIKGISSKSFAHRALFCASQADKPTKIYLPDICDDVLATISCLKSLGTTFRFEKNYVTVIPKNFVENNFQSTKSYAVDRKIFDNKRKNTPIFDARQSGTTLRFIMPFAMSVIEDAIFTASNSLVSRPISQIMQVMKSSGVEFTSNNLPIRALKKFAFDKIAISSDISSQYVSGLLLSSALQDSDVELKVLGDVKSKPYIDMTVKVMEDFGIKIDKIEDGYIVHSKGDYFSPLNYKVEMDYSAAAFFIVAGAFSEEGICLEGFDKNSLQGDKSILRIIEKYGANVKFLDDKIYISSGEKRPLKLNVKNIPDLVPILAVLACSCQGRSIFVETDRLKFKESDRVKSTLDLVNSLGGRAYSGDNFIVIDGLGNLKGGFVKTYNDHRIAMAASIASIICKEPVIIEDEKVVSKSYATFYEDFNSLGGNYVFTAGK